MAKGFKKIKAFPNYSHDKAIYYSYKITMLVKFERLVQKVVCFKDYLVYLSGIIVMVLFRSF